MRILFGGLMGLCLLVSTPMEVQARGDARAAVHNRSTARALPTPPRSMAPHSSVRPSMMVGSARQPSMSGGRYAMSLPSGRQHGFQSREPAYAFRGSFGRNAVQPRGRAYAAIPYGRPLAHTPYAYRQTAMASCAIRGGRRLCTTGATRSVAFRWGSDLGAASMSQSSCPDGTIATIAVGHTDVVRCVPL